VLVDCDGAWTAAQACALLSEWARGRTGPLARRPAIFCRSSIGGRRSRHTPGRSRIRSTGLRVARTRGLPRRRDGAAESAFRRLSRPGRAAARR
jgi:hypothetical protein